MSIFSKQTPGERLPLHWKSPLAPTSLAFYVTWIAVAYGPLRLWLQGRLQDSDLAYAGITAQWALLLLFIARAVLDTRTGIRREWLALAVVAQVPLALIACAAFNDGLQPALLIPVVAQIALGFPRCAATILILVSDFAFAWILLSQPSWRDLPGLNDSAPSHASLLVAYLGFQAFAIGVAVFARRAEEAREAAVRVNAELLATRELLKEGARSDERLRLSRELHDVAGHKLTALKLHLTLAQRQHDALKDPSKDFPADVLSESRQLADELLSDIRGITSALREHDGIDLQQALRALTGTLPYPAIELVCDPLLRVPGMEQAHTLLRCAQEGLTNVLRHSGASRVSLRLSAAAGGLCLCIEDNGSGLGNAAPGHGLNGLRERLEALGGTLEFAPIISGGTRLTALLPAA